ncbi:hypothetical protein [Trueperella abortisuis]|uniref:Uncharacterized protein n=1 Tax=Trueperella abortisuis TaxID=445930 RepID=A0ABT9PLL5_9ACTO|nr:hypothetical protein [Trueperella abortisuis]MDP9833025.1 hypothetical protein [Trueperella abortisuis]
MGATPKPVHVFSRRELVPITIEIPLPDRSIPDTLDFRLRHSAFTLFDHCQANQYRLTSALELYTDRHTALWSGIVAHLPELPKGEQSSLTDIVGQVPIAKIVDNHTHLPDLTQAPPPQHMLHPTEHTVSMRTRLKDNDDYNQALDHLLDTLLNRLADNELVMFTTSRPKVTRDRVAGRLEFLVATVRVWARTNTHAHIDPNI